MNQANDKFSLQIQLHVWRDRQSQLRIARAELDALNRLGPPNPIGNSWRNAHACATLEFEICEAEYRHACENVAEEASEYIGNQPLDGLGFSTTITESKNHEQKRPFNLPSGRTHDGP